MQKRESKLWQVAREQSKKKKKQEKWSENVCNFMLNDFLLRCVATFGANHLGGVFSQLNGFKFEFYLLMREESVR